ncbi:MAG: hypothetical protein ACFFCP_09465 [Promethearchaeota archaeon]
MKLQFNDTSVPYPISVIKGRLRLSGLSDKEVSEIILSVSKEIASKEKTNEVELLNLIRNCLEPKKNSVRDSFEILSKYEELRSESDGIPPIVVIIEGASATGKSVIAIELVHDLLATRFISSDTVRQILRSTMSEEKYPELFCHTYQAHQCRQSGPDDLPPVVRGYLAQCDIITPEIVEMTKRILSEGAIGVIEGVHIPPGTLQGLSPGIVEILIHPNDETHRAMFTNKYSASKLRTVSKDIETREKEYQAARAIQEHMMSLARGSNVHMVEMADFQEATSAVYKIIVSNVQDIVEGVE